MAKKLPVASAKSKEKIKPQNDDSLVNGKKRIPKALKAGWIKK
jgi:hypothetical protein